MRLLLKHWFLAHIFTHLDMYSFEILMLEDSG